MQNNAVPPLTGLFDRMETQAAQARRAAGRLAATLAAQASNPDFLVAQGQRMREQRRWRDAERHCRRAVEIKPEHALGWLELGLSLDSLKRPQEAVECWRRCLQLDPACVDAHVQLAEVLAADGDEGLAARHWEAAADSDDSPSAELLRGMLQLGRGGFAAGWKGFANRPAKLNFVESPLRELPAWDGRLDAATRLVLHKEGGPSEQVLFASCLPDALARDTRLLVECDAEIRPLLERSFPSVQFASDATASAAGFAQRFAHARQGLLGDLAAAARPARESFPPRNRYLLPCPRKRRAARAWLNLIGGEFKIGLGLLSAKEQKEGRSGAELNAMLTNIGDQLMATHGVTLIDLMNGSAWHSSERGSGQRGAACGLPVGEPFATDIDARAALIAELDLVITPANLNAHLRGAVGGRGLVILPWLPKWCWMTQGQETPWYPELRLFRPRRQNLWNDVASRLTVEASQAVRRRKPFAGPVRAESRQIAKS